MNTAAETCLQRILAASLSCLVLWSGAPAQAETKRNADLVLDYRLELPSYMEQHEGPHLPADTPPGLYWKLASDWASQQRNPDGESVASVELLTKRESLGRNNHLISTRVLKVELFGADCAKRADELDALLASPGDAAAPLPPALRGSAAEFQRRYLPEYFEPHPVWIDGVEVSYPEGVGQTAREYICNFIQMFHRSRRIIYFDLRMVDPASPPQFGPLVTAQLEPDGHIRIETQSLPWDFIPAGLDPAFFNGQFYREGDTDAKKMKSVKFQIDKSLYRSNTPPQQIEAQTLVYPLLPPLRWQPWLPDSAYALDEGSAAQTRPLYDAYKQALTDWLAAHPEFADADRAQDYCSGYGQAWYAEPAETTGLMSEKRELLGYLSYKVNFHSADPAMLESLRAALDSVPGVHPRVELGLTLHVYNSELGGWTY